MPLKKSKRDGARGVFARRSVQNASVRRAAGARAEIRLQPLEARRLMTDISGTLYSDNNTNGLKNAGEPALAGWTVYLDQNQNRTRDGGETFTTTDANGNYTFSGLIAGTYYVAQEPQAGWLAT